MRLLRRNTTLFEYLTYQGESDDLNESGEHTGEFHPVYGNPVTYRGNISTPSGYASQTFYGEDIRYNYILVMDDVNADISETGIIRWKGNLYDIRAVRPSLNVLSIALRRQSPDNTEAVVEESEVESDELHDP